MATYDSLTDEQKKDIATYEGFLRGVARQLIAMIKEADPETWNQFAKDNVDSVMTTLGPTEIIPLSTGHAGAKNLTAKECQDLQALARTTLRTLQQNWSLLVKASGPNT